MNTPRISIVKFGFIAVLSTLLVMAAAGNAFCGKDPIGQVTHIKGSVKSINPAGAELQLQLNSPIYLMDRVVTAGDGHLGISFNDKSYFWMSPDSDVTIDTYVYKPKGEDNAFNMSIIKGLFVVVAGKIAKTRDRFTARTTLAVIGVRGTSFGVMHQPSDAWVEKINQAKKGKKGLTVSPEDLYVFNFAGKTYVESPEGDERTYQSGPCYYCVVKPVKEKETGDNKPKKGWKSVCDCSSEVANQMARVLIPVLPPSMPPPFTMIPPWYSTPPGDGDDDTDDDTDDTDDDTWTPPDDDDTWTPPDDDTIVDPDDDTDDEDNGGNGGNGGH